MMISKENFKEVLVILGFKPLKNSDIFIKRFLEHNCKLKVDFSKGELIYPEQIKKESNTTSNFSQNENFVVFECVNRLLEKGYKPEHLILEKTWIIGDAGKSGRADITILDDKGKEVLLIIECKTAGNEYKKERAKLFESSDGRKLFSYAAQARSTKWLDLYASDFDTDSKTIKLYETTLKVQDDENILTLASKDESILTFKNASQASDLFKVWEETYNKKFYENLIFSQDCKPYDIGTKPLKKRDLKEFNKDDGMNVAFKEILRHNNISDKENAFNKLLSLFICKLVDEQDKSDESEVEFQYKQTDTYFSLYSRLLRLFHKGMQDFLKEDVYNIDEDSYIPATLDKYLGKNRNELIKELQKTLRNTKLLSSQFFSFIEVYNEKLFLQNGKILVEMVELFQGYKLSYTTKQQFLSDLFEQLINEGFKQDEGQFFTPIPITRFVWNSLPFETFINLDSKSFPKVIDYACGAGHFLTEGISAIKDYIQSKGQNITDEEISSFFYGVDKDNRLAKLSKVAMFLNGANKVNIQALDGLEHDSIFYSEKIENDKKQRDFYLSQNAFDILATNPPFSVKAFKSHLKRKLLKEFDTLELISFVDKSIENVFVERITQILKPNAVTAIVLPSSILSNTDSSTIKTREILFTNFSIKSIVAFGSQAFGATGTNTIILFLKRFNEPPKQEILLKDSIEAILNNENLQSWEDEEILHSYLNLQNLDSRIYSDFLNDTLDIDSSEYFKAYYNAFNAQSEIITLKNSNKFKALDKKEQEKLLKRKFKDYALSIEKDKLYFFALTFKSQTLIIKSPDDTANQKKFLGYEISNAKSKRAGLSEFEYSPLSDKQNRFATDKLSYLVKQSFNENFALNLDSKADNLSGGVRGLGRINENQKALFDFLDSIKASVNYVKTSDLLDFSQVDFKKAINLNISSKNGSGVYSNPFENCKYELVKLSEILTSEGKGKRPASFADKNGIYPFIKSSKNIEKCNEADFDFEAIIIGDGGMANIHYMNERFSSSDHTYIFSNAKNKAIILKFIYHIINSNLEILEAGFKGIGIKNISKTFIQNLKIPLPPLEIQKQIVEQCEEIEKQYQSIRMSIEEYQKLIKEILIKCGVVADGGGESLNSILENLANFTKELLNFASSQESEATKAFYTNELNENQNTQSTLPRNDAERNYTISSNDEQADLQSLKELLNSLPTPPPHGWENIRLNNSQYLTLNPSKQEIQNVDENTLVSFIEMASVSDSGYIKNKIDKSLKELKSKGYTYFAENDILIAKITPCMENGKCGIALGLTNSIGMGSSEFHVFRTKQGLINKFLFLLLNRNEIRQEAAKNMTGASGHRRVPIDFYKNLKIPLPPLKAQEKIVSVIDFIETKISQLETTKENLDSKKDEILLKYLG